MCLYRDCDAFVGQFYLRTKREKGEGGTISFVSSSEFITSVLSV